MKMFSNELVAATFSLIFGIDKFMKQIFSVLLNVSVTIIVPDGNLQGNHLFYDVRVNGQRGEV